MLLLLVNLAKTIIWQCHNTRKHEEKKDSITSLKYNLIWKIKVKCLADFHVLHKNNFFGCKFNVICQVIDNKPVFFLWLHLTPCLYKIHIKFESPITFCLFSVKRMPKSVSVL